MPTLFSSRSITGFLQKSSTKKAAKTFLSYYSVTFTNKLTTNLASLEVRRYTRLLPPQQHPFCIWKHQADGQGLQIKCTSQTRTHPQTMCQTKRARSSRTKRKHSEETRSARLDHSNDFICPDALAFSPSPLRFASPAENASRANSGKSILPSYLGNACAGRYHIPERKF